VNIKPNIASQRDTVSVTYCRPGVTPTPWTHFDFGPWSWWTHFALSAGLSAYITEVGEIQKTTSHL